MLIGEKDFFIERVMTNEDAEIMHSFIELFYTKEIIPPPVILMNTIPSENKALLALLRNNRSDAVVFEIPKEGKKADLLSMANENALISFRKRTKSPDEVLDAIAKKLDIRQQLSCIGAFDVSTIQGSASVGAFICWNKGDFNKECYRHMKIKGVVGVDDYAMMKEIVQRTLSKPGSAMPDLIIIDGGKGQLDAAQKAVGEMGVEVEMISIAKKPDRAFLPDGRVIDLQDRSRESLLLRKIRDEAHRFAIGFHRKLRDKRLMESQLEKIPGIGTKRRLALLRHFGSLDAIRAASVDDIMQLKGFSKAIAERLVKGIKD
jgi:excinuclease ABC subunit C